MPVTYAPEDVRAANRRQLYADLSAAMNTPYSATSGGWYGPPVYGGPDMLPAVQASGAHYSAPGSREGWIEHGIPPVVYQRSPYATAAFRAVPDPWGGMTVAPLVGFPSRYPHVLSGVPTRPGTLAMSVAAPYLMRPPAPAAPARQPAANGGGKRRRPTVKDPGMLAAHTTDPGMRAAHTSPARTVDWNAPIQTSHHRDVSIYPPLSGGLLGVSIPPEGAAQTPRDPGMARASATTTQQPTRPVVRQNVTQPLMAAHDTARDILSRNNRFPASGVPQSQSDVYRIVLRNDRGY